MNENDTLWGGEFAPIGILSSGGYELPNFDQYLRYNPVGKNNPRVTYTTEEPTNGAPFKYNPYSVTMPKTIEEMRQELMEYAKEQDRFVQHSPFDQLGWRLQNLSDLEVAKLYEDAARRKSQYMFEAGDDETMRNHWETLPIGSYVSQQLFPQQSSVKYPQAELWDATVRDAARNYAIAHNANSWMAATGAPGSQIDPNWAANHPYETLDGLASMDRAMFAPVEASAGLTGFYNPVSAAFNLGMRSTGMFNNALTGLKHFGKTLWNTPLPKGTVATEVLPGVLTGVATGFAAQNASAETPDSSNVVLTDSGKVPSAGWHFESKEPEQQEESSGGWGFGDIMGTAAAVGPLAYEIMSRKIPKFRLPKFKLGNKRLIEGAITLGGIGYLTGKHTGLFGGGEDNFTPVQDTIYYDGNGTRTNIKGLTPQYGVPTYATSVDDPVTTLDYSNISDDDELDYYSIQ